MNHARIVPLGLCLIGVATIGAAPAAAAQRPCRPVGAKVVRSTGEVRVYLMRDDGTYVCSLQTGKRRRIDDQNPDNDDGAFAQVFDVRGPYVAYETYVTTERTRLSVLVRSIDARTGKIRVNAAAFTDSLGMGGTSPVPGVHDLSLMPTGGRVAWISPTSQGGPTEVWYASGSQATRLDSGADIVGGSLAVGLSRVYWMRGDGAHGAAV